MNSIWGAVIVPLVWLIDIGWIVEGETSDRIYREKILWLDDWVYTPHDIKNSPGVTNSTVKEIEMVDWFNLSNNIICHSLEEYSFTCVVVDREFIKGSVEIVIYATSGISVHAENLDSEESLFTWQATGVAKGNYILSAKAISNSGKSLRGRKIIVVTD